MLAQIPQKEEDSSSPAGEAENKQENPPIELSAQEKDWLLKKEGLSRRWMPLNSLLPLATLYSLVLWKKESSDQTPATLQKWLDTFKVLKEALTASSTQGHWIDAWLLQPGDTKSRVTFYNNQLLKFPENPYLWLLLGQSLEQLGWKTIGFLIKNEALTWVKEQKDKWEAIIQMTIDPATDGGKTEWQSFLKEIYPERDGEKEFPGSTIEEDLYSSLAEFKTYREEKAQRFPWEILSSTEQEDCLNHLFEIVEKLATLLSEEQIEADAIDAVNQEIEIPLTLMERL